MFCYYACCFFASSVCETCRVVDIKASFWKVFEVFREYDVMCEVIMLCVASWVLWGNSIVKSLTQCHKTSRTAMILTLFVDIYKHLPSWNRFKDVLLFSTPSLSPFEADFGYTSSHQKILATKYVDLARHLNMCLKSLPCNKMSLVKFVPARAPIYNFVFH